MEMTKLALNFNYDLKAKIKNGILVISFYGAEISIPTNKEIRISNVFQEGLTVLIDKQGSENDLYNFKLLSYIIMKYISETPFKFFFEETLKNEGIFIIMKKNDDSECDIKADIYNNFFTIYLNKKVFDFAEGLKKNSNKI